jgi:hypothetical protein
VAQAQQRRSRLHQQEQHLRQRQLQQPGRRDGRPGNPILIQSNNVRGPPPAPGKRASWLAVTLQSARIAQVGLALSSNTGVLG